MSTNYYLRRKVPRIVEVYDELHIAKRSGGWKMLFQAHPEEGIRSLHAIKERVGSGEWEIINEYGDALTFDEFLEARKPYKSGYEAEHGQQSHRACDTLRVFLDGAGNEWTEAEFS